MKSLCRELVLLAIIAKRLWCMSFHREAWQRHSILTAIKQCPICKEVY